jgi:glucose/arabinose dehydrogenase
VACEFDAGLEDFSGDAAYYFDRMRALCALALVVAAAGCPNVAGRSAVDLGSVRLPPGFAIAVYANGLPGARSLALGERGTLFVGTRDAVGAGQVYAVVDRDGDQRGDAVYVVARGLNRPNGVAVRDGALYVAEIDRVLRFDGIESALATPPSPVVVNDSFPSENHHGWKYLRFAPDGRLYVPVGAPCDACGELQDPFGTILRMQPDGSNLEVYARGIRNTVGFDFHPDTGDLWFTENGQDTLGDEVPPDELDWAPQPGMHFGFPYCNGTLEDPSLGHGCSEFTPPAIALGAHVAALGMRFYTGTMFPSDYRGRIFIAEHGSAHRSDYAGYRLTTVRLDGNAAVAYEPFADGFLKDGESWARPVDVLVMPDGALLFSDDRSDAVYRISYAGGLL